MFMYFLVLCCTDEVKYFNTISEVIDYCVKNTLTSDDYVLFEGVKR